MSSESSAPGTASISLSVTRVRIVLSGELDLARRAAVEAACSEALAHELPVDLDVRDVTFLDSTILSVFFGLATATPLRVVGPNDLVRFLFDMTGLSSQVELVDAPPGAPSAR